MRTRCKRFQWLALFLLIILIGSDGCNPADLPAVALNEVILGNWRPKIYKPEADERWREISSLDARFEVNITPKTIRINRYDLYNNMNKTTYELEVLAIDSDTLYTGSWKTEPWITFLENEKVYRVEDDEKKTSIWLQCGDQEIIMDRTK